MTSRLLVLVTLLAPALAAGCLQDGSGAQAAACPTADAPQAEPEGGTAPVPVWRTGDWWNHSILDEDGAVIGVVRHDVVGCEHVNGVDAYRLRRTYQRWDDHDHDGTLDPLVREEHYDVRDLNQVWDVCDGPPMMGPCKGRHAEWDFPLEDGKAWTEPCCGDVIMDYRHSVEHDPDAPYPPDVGGRGPVWNVSVSTDGHDDPHRVWVYAPDVGFFTERVGSDGHGGARWVLTAYRQHAPSAS